MSKHVVSGGSHTRLEGGKTVTYTTGQPINVTKKEIEAFPGKFALVETPSDTSKEDMLTLQVTALEIQVKTLQDENADLKKQLEQKPSEPELKTNPADEGGKKK